MWDNGLRAAPAETAVRKGIKTYLVCIPNSIYLVTYKLCNAEVYTHLRNVCAYIGTLEDHQLKLSISALSFICRDRRYRRNPYIN